MTHIAFIVSPNHLDLMPGLVPQGHARNVEIIVDRRHGDRRSRAELVQFPDRRHFERRSRSNYHELELIGIAVVLIP